MAAETPAIAWRQEKKKRKKVLTLTDCFPIRDLCEKPHLVIHWPEPCYMATVSARLVGKCSFSYEYFCTQLNQGSVSKKGEWILGQQLAVSATSTNLQKSD